MTFKQRLALRYTRVKLALLSFWSNKAAAKAALELFRTPQYKTSKHAPAIFGTAEKLQFNLDDITIVGYRWNYKRKKKVLIIHGFQSSVFNFEQYIQPLISKGYEVLAFDAPAHGGSGGKWITAPLFAKMIKSIHELYGPMRSFLAHSFGGLALSLALENMPHDNTYKVVLIAPATETKTAIDQFFELFHLDEDVREEFDKLIATIGGRPPEWYSIRRAIRNIKAMVLWIHDVNDQQTPINDAWKVKHENLPNVRFMTTRGLGHRRIYRDEKIMRTVIDFL